MKSDTPAISVVMSVFNGEKYLAEAIESILSQTFSDFEFIIVNDGSTDSSLSIIQAYMKQDYRIVSISRDNKGLPYSLNEAISIAKGKYIARMDADDVALENRLEKQFDLMELKPEVGVCGGWAQLFGDIKASKKIIKHPENDSSLKTKLFFSVCFVHPTVMFRSEVLYEESYNNDFLNSQDFDLWSRLSKNAVFYNLQMVLIMYRINDSSITSNVSKEKYDVRYEYIKSVYVRFYEYFSYKPSESILFTQYIIASNDRIMKTDLSYYEVRDFFSQAIAFNNKYKVYSFTYFNDMLFKKSLVWFFFNIKKKRCFMGMFRFFLSKVFWKLFFLFLFRVSK